MSSAQRLCQIVANGHNEGYNDFTLLLIRPFKVERVRMIRSQTEFSTLKQLDRAKEKSFTETTRILLLPQAIS